MPQYDFSSLSPYDFEDLVRDLLQEELGVTLESFKTGRDSGIDLRYAADPAGTLIVQCKHYAGSSYSALYRELERELPKIRRLGRPRYIVATSLGLTPSNKDSIRELFDPFILSTGDILGCDDLNNLLGKFPAVERRNFKLWLTSQTVLERVLHSAVFNRTETELELVKRRLRYYVQNESFPQAQRLLEETHVCIIVGGPGIGKTTLAEMLLVDHLARGYEAVRITSDISEAYQVYDPTTHQIFYYDDFLGQATFDAKLGKNEDQSLLQFLHTVANSPNKRLILTTREYILNHAKATYERLDRADLDPYKCVVGLEQYTRFHRAKILYNHLYFSALSPAFKAAIVRDAGYRRIVDHPNYNPRMIEWTIAYARAGAVPPEEFLPQFVASLDDPIAVWWHVFEHQLTNACRDVLLVLATLPHQVLHEDLVAAFNPLYTLRRGGRGRAELAEDLRSALRELDGTFIRTEMIGQSAVIELQNPSVRDFLVHYLANSPDDLADVCEAAAFFTQYEIMWGPTFPWPYPRPLRSPLLSHSAQLVAGLRRCFESAGCALARALRDGEITLVRLDPLPEDRAPVTLQVAAELGSEEAQEMVEEALGVVLSNLRQECVDPVSLVDLLETLKTARFSATPAGESLVVESKDYLLQKLRWERDLDVFEWLAGFMDLYPQVFSPDEQASVESDFEDFCTSEVENWVDGGLPDGGSLRRNAETLSRVAAVLDVDVEEHVELLEQRARALDASVEHERHERDDRDERREADRTDAQAIDSLFETLTEPAAFAQEDGAGWSGDRGPDSPDLTK